MAKTYKQPSIVSGMSIQDILNMLTDTDKSADEIVTALYENLSSIYEKIIHNKTPLTPQEIAYCVNDVRVVRDTMSINLREMGQRCKNYRVEHGYSERV